MASFIETRPLSHGVSGRMEGQQTDGRTDCRVFAEYKRRLFDVLRQYVLDVPVKWYPFQLIPYRLVVTTTKD